MEDYEIGDSEVTAEDLTELGAWGQKETDEDVQFGQQLNAVQIEEAKRLVSSHRYLFTDLPGDTNLAEHCIELNSSVPVRQRPYPVPYALRDSLQAELTTMENLGIIRKSTSPYASPVVVVKKKDGSNRVCIDYRRLNKITVFDPHPTVPPAEVFQGMSGDKFFTKIDLSKGYWQIPVRQEDVPKTAFVTLDQHYEFLRMPFGMMNSGATLTRAVRELLSGMNNVVSYVDDILVHTETWQEHVSVLTELFRRMEAANITARPTKCVIGAADVEFVGHRLGQGAVSLQEDNVEKIHNAARPKTKKEVRSFFGLVGYYHDFIPNFAAVAAPLSDLTKKGQPNHVKWSEPQEKAYASLKQAIIRKPILQLPDMGKGFVLRTDASDVGVGAALLQDAGGKLFPVAFASKKLLPREQKYSTIEKECLAIVWGVKKFSLYLYGKQFVLQTDHNPLQYLNTAKFDCPRVMRWILFLQSYSFSVEHIKGSENVEADFLSRVV